MKRDKDIPPILDVLWGVFGIPRHHIMVPSRGIQRVAFARQVGMYLHHKLVSQSISVTGRAFKRDHTTVCYAVKKIRALEQSGDSDVLAAVKMYHERTASTV